MKLLILLTLVYIKYLKPFNSSEFQSRCKHQSVSLSITSRSFSISLSIFLSPFFSFSLVKVPQSLNSRHRHSHPDYEERNAATAPGRERMEGRHPPSAAWAFWEATCLGPHPSEPRIFCWSRNPAECVQSQPLHYLPKPWTSEVE